MGKEWFLYKDGEKQGPFSWAQLYLKGIAGGIDPGDLVWVDGMKNWTRAEEVKNLLAEKHTPLNPALSSETPLPPPEAAPALYPEQPPAGSASGTGPQAEKWHLSRGGQSYGPYTEEQFRQLIQDGNVRPGDLVWNETLTDWVLADSLDGLL